MSIDLKEKSDLTNRQAALLHVIQTFLNEKGYPPAQRQLARLLGKQLRSIQELLERLQRKGYVKYDRGVTRSLRLIRCRLRHPSSNGDGKKPQKKTTPEQVSLPGRSP